MSPRPDRLRYSGVRMLCSLSPTLALFVALSGVLSGTTNARAQDPLPSWNDAPAKQAILAFVKDTTEKSSSKYVEPADRIATFDREPSGPNIPCTAKPCSRSTA
jgi:hypothetical protein